MKGDTTLTDAKEEVDISFTQNIYGTLDNLIELHRTEINTGKVYPHLPLVFFRVGSKLSPSDQWYFALLNRPQLTAATEQGMEQVFEDYRHGKDIEIMPKEILELTLEQMLQTYTFPEPSYERLPEDFATAYQNTRAVVFGKDAEEPVVRYKYDPQRVILYNLLANPDKQNQVDLSRKVKDSLSYIRVSHKEKDTETGGEIVKMFGVITIDLSYVIHGKGGLSFPYCP